MWAILEKLGQLKNTNPALHGGKNPASYENIETNNENILVFKRHKNANTITFVANLSHAEQTLENNLEGNYLDYMHNTKVTYTKAPLLLKPWEYKLLVSN